MNITDWIPTAEAGSLIKELIASGEYKKGELKKSSCKFANGKDKTDGYLCRVIVVSDIKKVPAKQQVIERKRVTQSLDSEEFSKLDSAFKVEVANASIEELEDMAGDLDLLLQCRAADGIKVGVERMKIEKAYIEAILCA